MKTKLTLCLSLALAASVFVPACSTPQTAQEGEYAFEVGYPTPEASQALYDEMDYQRAVQAYIWATPMLNSMGWRAGLARFGVTEENHKFIVFQDSMLPQQRSCQ